MSYFSHLYCSRCEKSFDVNQIVNLCECGSPILAGYNLTAARKFPKEDLNGRRPDMWRYREMLPVFEEKNKVSLGEGFTPILPLNRLGRELGLNHLMCKDEGLNPTGSFKARGAAAGVSRAVELGITEIAMPTAGNAGGAWASYAARKNIKSHIAMPRDAPSITATECAVAGASVYLVEGNIADCGKIIAQGAEKYGWFEVSTLKEPYRIEGKKIMGYEIMEQLNWDPPDYIFYPTGGGVGIIGIWKAIREMEAIGWLEGTKRPKMVVVQSEGCAPLVKAFQEGKKTAEPWPNPQTDAAGIRVPRALGDFLVLKAVRESGGTALAVGEEEIKNSVQKMAQKEGLFICPEGGANLAALEKLLQQGVISDQDRVLLLNTGAGIKYPEILSFDFPILEKGARL